jgi:putative peptidoglycan lipid II flippase
MDPLRALTGVAFLSALGMLMGYARDASLAAVFGASARTDAFFVATILPTMVATVIMSGALAPALLPVFRARLATRERAWALANTLFTLGGVALAGFVLLLFAAAPPLVGWVAPGLDAATFEQAVTLTRQSAPLIFLLGMSALAGAPANALGAFRLPALSTVFVNGIAFVAIVTLGASIGISSAVWGLTAGAGLQLVVQAVGLYRQGWRPAPGLDWRSADMRETLRLFLPLAAFVLLAQSVPVVERMLGSLFSAGDLSLVTYAGKLFQIPGAVLSTSLAVVLYPHLVQTHLDASRAGGSGDWNETLAQALRASIFLTLPLALWFFWNAGALVRLIFLRGAFSPQDAQVMAELVQAYMLAVVPAGLLLVLTRALHARRKMGLTLLLGVVNTAVYVALAFVLTRVLGLRGLPFAFAGAQLFGCVLFGAFAFRGRAAWSRGNRSVVATLAAGVIVAVGLGLSAPFIAPLQGVGLLVGLGVLLALTAGVYVGLAAWGGSAEARAYLEMGSGLVRRLAGTGLDDRKKGGENERAE